MAGTSLLALIDDIATVLDDVAVMSKIAAKKTAGVLGDDLALNAQQVSGVSADRELPVVWAVAMGSLRNKLILVPLALATSSFAPWAVTPLLMFGGAYLCYEGFEKLAHKFMHGAAESKAEHENHLLALQDASVDMLAYERDKVKGAIRTDFILSAEIIVIALGTVASAPFSQQLTVLAAIGLIMTVGVYGFVAAIVKLDDLGYYLIRTQAKNTLARLRRAAGNGLLKLAPWLMKTLSVVGTAAMFLVGGGIILHGFPHAHELLERAEATMASLPVAGSILGAITPTVLDGFAGVLTGAACLLLLNLGAYVRNRLSN